MEVKSISTPAAVPSVSPMKPGEGQDLAQRDKRVQPAADVKPDNKVRQHRPRADAPKPITVRLELRIDDSTNQVFGRVIDRETGEEIRQIPAESIRHLQAISRELFDSLVDETV